MTTHDAARLSTGVSGLDLDPALAVLATRRLRDGAEFGQVTGRTGARDGELDEAAGVVAVDERRLDAVVVRR